MNYPALQKLRVFPLLAALTTKSWDVIVIGTGIGGGSIGRRLAERGLSVLFVERGLDRAADKNLPLGVTGEEARLAAGLWPRLLEADVDGKRIEVDHLIGAGVGGTSVFYAGTLERPEPHDLDDLPGRPHPTGGWPVGYDGFRHYFDMVERYFNVSGTPDLLSDEPAPEIHHARPMSEGDSRTQRFFADVGMHPYQTHLGLRSVSGADGGKMNGRSAGVEPALKTGRAALLDNCEVLRLETDGPGGRITAIHCRHAGQPLELRARSYVVAGGALNSAALLLRSGNEHWQDGLGNRSGLVGRNLMFHLSLMFAVWPGLARSDQGAGRSVSLRDLYFHEGQRFGTIQTMGVVAGFPEILHGMRNSLSSNSPLRVGLLRHALRVPALAMAKTLGSARMLVGIMEDLPYLENRLIAHPEDSARIHVSYRIADELRARNTAFRQAIQRALKGRRHFFLNREPLLNYSHCCGTLRFGQDPRNSVLNPDCRVHGVDNLYVTDSSFMPTSTGTNPSLLIAANALRVADIIADRAAPHGGLVAAG